MNAFTMNVVPAAHDRDTAERRLGRHGQSVLNDRGRRWASLLDRIAAGDADAIGTLYDESSSLTFGLIMHILQDQETAEEALVDVYVRVRDQVQSRGPDDDAVSWMIRLARGAALARRKPDARPRNQAPPALPAAPATSVTPFEPLRRERLQIGSAMDQLTARQRSIIQMTYFGGLTARDVAAALEISTQHVMSEIRRAMLTLRHLLPRVHAD